MDIEQLLLLQCLSVSASLISCLLLLLSFHHQFRLLTTTLFCSRAPPSLHLSLCFASSWWHAWSTWPAYRPWAPRSLCVVFWHCGMIFLCTCYSLSHGLPFLVHSLPFVSLPPFRFLSITISLSHMDILQIFQYQCIIIIIIYYCYHNVCTCTSVAISQSHSVLIHHWACMYHCRSYNPAHARSRCLSHPNPISPYAALVFFVFSHSLTVLL